MSLVESLFLYTFVVCARVLNRILTALYKLCH